MLKAKKKLCVGCKSEQYIWKKQGRDRYCKPCWFKHIATTKPVKFKKPKPIKKVSTKMSAQLTVYTQVRRVFMEKHPMCEAKLPGCNIHSTDVHHKKGRGEHLLDTTTWLSVCRTCHNWIEEHPKDAIQLGYSEPRQ